MTTDPFEALYDPARPVEPDAVFAAALRRRLERAILDPQGATMTNTETTSTGSTGTESTSTASTGTASRTQAQTHAVTPYLAVTDARQAIGFYVDVLGARRLGELVVMPDGRVGHAELEIGDSVIILAEEFPEYGHVAPLPAGPAPSYYVEVADVDQAVERATRGGGRLVSAVSDSGHGRSGSIVDPFGHRWIVSAAPAQVKRDDTGPRHGEAGYFTLTVPDQGAARQFYGAVLGWHFSPGRTPGGWEIDGTGLRAAGLWGGQGQEGWRLMYAVSDLDAALELVRANGGRASDPRREPYGLAADCTDNQGIDFWLWQVPG